ncbi:MAG: type III PLP-dependent enzyme [Nanoarchaeota archaeon]|mgnify:CR=1 FL=1
MEHLSAYDYWNREELNRIKEFAQGKKTPFLVVDLQKISWKFEEIKRNLPYAQIYYAVKANPLPEVIELLREKGSYFDVASIYEINLLLEAGVPPEKMSYGNTIKKEEDIAYAYEVGLRIFTTDSESDLKKISRNAPGSKVIFKIISEGSGSFSDWPLSKKFGAHPEMIHKLIVEAVKMSIVPYGLSFHVGSQQRDVGQWDLALAICHDVFEEVEKDGIKLQVLNIGGGFPAKYLNPTLSTEEYARKITQYLQRHFKEMPLIMMEPGRSLTGDSGIIVSEVSLVSKKSDYTPNKWVYLDVGKFGGLIETLDESVKYPIFLERYLDCKPQKFEEVILAGPTCDSFDILYERTRYKLPADITDGDKVYIFTTGAYTLSYCSICFNGLPPLKSYVIDLGKD